MALAKYSEDIDDRYSDDNWERINALFAVRDFGKEWREHSRIESAAVAAKSNGQFFEDRMVFLRSAKVHFAIECSSSTQPIVASFTPNGFSTEVLQPNAQGRFALKQPNQDGRLQLQCGFYTKTYAISFLNQPKPEALPDVRNALAAIISNPAQWSAAGFETLRFQLETCLAVPAIPDEFAFGVKEFYLGLFHESIGEANFRKRLETSFHILRPFCPYSDYATLICAYYFYRVNCFERVAPLTQIPAMSRVAGFFLTSYEKLKTDIQSSANKEKSAVTEILVSNGDYAVFKAVERFLASDVAGCAIHLEEAGRVTEASLDPQGDERLKFIRARLARYAGKVAEARRIYGMLQNSATDTIRVEVQEYLNLSASKP